MEIYNILKLVLFTLGLASLITAGFLVSLVTGFVTAGVLMVAVAIILQRDIDGIPQKKGRG